MNKLQKLLAELGRDNIAFTLNQPLAPFTTWKIGGPAEVLIEIYNTEDFIKVIKTVRESGINLTILGAGSNVLISDDGIKGVVIINKIEYLEIGGSVIAHTDDDAKRINLIEARLKEIDTEEYYAFDEVEYDEFTLPKIEVKISSGYYLPRLINMTISENATGLQWFAGIPGTLGGAIYNNIHGGTHFLSEYIESVKILDTKNNVKTMYKSELEFDYDSSFFHTSKDIILEATLHLYRGDSKKALASAIAWAQKKRIQPYKSAGCCFRNLTALEMANHQLQSSSWGYIIDKVLSLKGIKAGDAIISTRHAAFIENLGHATAQDVLSLFDLIYTSAEDKLGIRPKTEIFMLGFPEELVSKYK